MIEDDVYLTLLGVKIQDLRKSKGLTQTDLAKALGTGQTQIARIERGEVNSTINMLRKVATALGVTIEDLVKIE